MGFSNKLKELRTEKNFTQKELALFLGLSSNSICEWEKGRCEPGIEQLKKLSALFECSIDYLADNADDFGNITINKAPLTNNLPTEEQKLLDDFRSLPRAERAQATEYVHYLAERFGSTKKKKA